MYDTSKERIRDQNYRIDCPLKSETMSVNTTPYKASTDLLHFIKRDMTAPRHY